MHRASNEAGVRAVEQVPSRRSDSSRSSSTVLALVIALMLLWCGRLSDLGFHGSSFVITRLRQSCTSSNDGRLVVMPTIEFSVLNGILIPET